MEGDCTDCKMLWSYHRCGLGGIFKSLYEVVRVQVAIKDASKIPEQRIGNEENVLSVVLRGGR
jgi:hypothetical protein